MAKDISAEAIAKEVIKQAKQQVEKQQMEVDKQPRGLSAEGREKYWKELNTEEKIERMKVNVKRLQRDVASLKRIFDRLRRHEHDKNSQLFVRESIGYDGGIEVTQEVLGPRGADDDKVYF